MPLGGVINEDSVDRSAAQPWARADTRPPDRAFFEEQFDRAERFDAERHADLVRTLKWMPLRWFLVWVGLSVLSWALYLVGFLIFMRRLGS